MLRRGVKCPCCSEPIEVLGLHWHSGFHWCSQAGIGLYTNGILFSTDFKEITVVERTRKATDKASEVGQVDGEMLSNVLQFELPHPTPSA